MSENSILALFNSLLNKSQQKTHIRNYNSGKVAFAGKGIAKDLSIKDVLKKTFKGDVYQVGGSVRDELLGLPSKDLDFVIVNKTYDAIKQELDKFGKIDIVGKSFGVMKFTVDGTVYDIAIPRKETSTGEGHKQFAVKTGVSLQEDLGRRDFTINSLAKNLTTNEVVDLFNGKEDIKNKQIRMVFKNTFKEDPLRMLRAIRFASRLDFSIEPATLKEIQDNAKLIKTISPERIQTELNGILVSNHPDKGLMLLDETGILKEILPEVETLKGEAQNHNYHKFDVFTHTINVIKNTPNKLEIRLAALLHDIGKKDTKTVGEDGTVHHYKHEEISDKKAKQILERLKYPNDTQDKVTLLVREHMLPSQLNERGIRRLLTRVGVNNIFDLLALKEADMRGGKLNEAELLQIYTLRKDVENQINAQNALSVKDLKVTGKDVMEHLNIPSGKKVGDTLNSLFDTVLDDPNLNNKEDLLRLLDQIKLEKSMHDFCSTQINFEDPIKTKMLEFGKELKEVIEVEDEPHVTVLYGIKDKDSKDKIKQKLMSGVLGKIGKFATPESDVLFVEIISDDLQDKYKEIRESVDVELTHKNYKPHATLAYVKTDSNNHLLGNTSFEGLAFVDLPIYFCCKNEDKIKLEKAIHLPDVSLKHRGQVNVMMHNRLTKKGNTSLVMTHTRAQDLKDEVLPIIKTSANDTLVSTDINQVDGATQLSDKKTTPPAKGCPLIYSGDKWIFDPMFDYDKNWNFDEKQPWKSTYLGKPIKKFCMSYKNYTIVLVTPTGNETHAEAIGVEKDAQAFDDYVRLFYDPASNAVATRTPYVKGLQENGFQWDDDLRAKAFDIQYDIIDKLRRHDSTLRGAINLSNNDVGREEIFYINNMESSKVVKSTQPKYGIGKHVEAISVKGGVTKKGGVKKPHIRLQEVGLTYQPYSNLKEVKQFLIASGIASKVNYTEDMDVSLANKVNGILFSLYKQYKFSPIEISNFNKETEKNKIHTYLESHYNKFNINSSTCHDDILYRDYENLVVNYQQGLLEKTDLLLAKYNALFEIDDENVEMLEKAKVNFLAIKEESKYKTGFAVPYNVDFLECMMVHELGHILADQKYDFINSDEDNRSNPVKKEWVGIYNKLRTSMDNNFHKPIHSISRYASVDANECFAECFSLYHYKQYDRLPNYVMTFMEKYFPLDKK